MESWWKPFVTDTTSRRFFAFTASDSVGNRRPESPATASKTTAIRHMARDSTTSRIVCEQRSVDLGLERGERGLGDEEPRGALLVADARLLVERGERRANPPGLGALVRAEAVVV